MEKEIYTYEFPHPAITADCVVFGFDGKDLEILLIKRAIEPDKGKWALPGGFMQIDETIEDCARRELTEETGLIVEKFEQFRAFSEVKRDPRERVVTIAFVAFVKQCNVRGGDDADDAKWFTLDDAPHLAFDHDYILRKALQYIREKIHFEPIGFDLLDENFTIPDLQRLYEAILGVKFDRRNFQKKIIQLGILDEIEEESNINNFIPTRDTSFKLRDIDELFPQEKNIFANMKPNMELSTILLEDSQNYECEEKSVGRKAKKYKLNEKKYDEIKQNHNFKLEF